MELYLNDKAYRLLMQESAMEQFAGVTAKTNDGVTVYVIEVSEPTFERTKEKMREDETFSDFIIRQFGYDERDNE